MLQLTEIYDCMKVLTIYDTADAIDNPTGV